MNPAGALVVLVGILLIGLGVSGRYRQAWAIVTGSGPSGPLPVTGQTA
jgi:hypothetical protein